VVIAESDVLATGETLAPPIINDRHIPSIDIDVSFAINRDVSVPINGDVPFAVNPYVPLPVNSNISPIANRVTVAEIPFA
jgi:hypothetical protein